MSVVLSSILGILKIFITVVIVELIGAFIFWMLKGFKGKYSAELFREGYRNFIIGSIIWTLLVLGVIFFISYKLQGSIIQN